MLKLFTLFFLLQSSLAQASLKIVSLNAWLLEEPVFGINIGRDINSRLETMPETLLKEDPDIIFLQEVWKDKFRSKIRWKLFLNGYRECLTDKDIPNRLGNGLVIYSKFLFMSPCQSLSYTTHTRRDEVFAKKGVLYTSIFHPEYGEIFIYNTHLGAVSFDKKKGAFKTKHVESRNAQAKELFEVIHNNTVAGYPYIVAGDFNMNELYFDPEQRRFRHSIKSRHYLNYLNEMEVIDSYREYYPNSKKNYGATLTTQNNYYKVLSSKRPQHNRIDFIFLSEKDEWEVVGSRVLKRDIKGRFLSDHFGLFSNIKLSY